jgi:hypothetical protein
MKNLVLRGLGRCNDLASLTGELSVELHTLSVHSMADSASSPSVRARHGPIKALWRLTAVLVTDYRCESARLG